MALSFGNMQCQGMEMYCMPAAWTAFFSAPLPDKRASTTMSIPMAASAWNPCRLGWAPLYRNGVTCPKLATPVSFNFFACVCSRLGVGFDWAGEEPPAQRRPHTRIVLAARQTVRNGDAMAVLFLSYCESLQVEKLGRDEKGARHSGRPLANGAGFPRNLLGRDQRVRDRVYG